jgi:hypothetical protein
MKRLLFGLMLFAAAAVLAIATSLAQPPDGGRPGKKGRGDGNGPPGGGPGGGPPRFELGRVLPPFVREELDLTEEQDAQIAALEKQVKAKLEKILTAEQKKKIRTIRPPMPPGGGDGPPDGPPDGGPEGRQNGRKPRPDGPPPGKDRTKPPDDNQASAGTGGIQWFTTWAEGKQEAARTGKPIMLVSAAPHCAGVSGIW